MLLHMVKPATASHSEGFCNSPSGSAVSALQSKIKQISQRQSKGKETPEGPPEFLQKKSDREPSSLNIPEDKIIKLSSSADEISEVQDLTTSIHRKKNEWKNVEDFISSHDRGPGEGSRMQSLTQSGDGGTVPSKTTSSPTHWVQSETLVLNRDRDFLPIPMENLVNTREEKQKGGGRGTVVHKELQGLGNLQSTFNRCLQNQQNPPDEPERDGILKTEKVQTTKATLAMLTDGQCEPPLINKGLPSPHKEADCDTTINLGSDLSLSPRHERAKRLLERARLKARSQNQNSDSGTQVTQSDILELLPMHNPPLQIITTTLEQKDSTSVHHQDVCSGKSEHDAHLQRQGQLRSHVNFEDKLKKDAENHSMDKVGHQGLVLMDSSQSKRQTKAHLPFTVSQKSKDLGSSYRSVGITLTNQGDAFLRTELSKYVKKCEACGSILTPSPPEEPWKNREGQRNSGNKWVSSGQSSHQFTQPNLSEGTMLTGCSNGDEIVETAGPSDAGESVSAFGKLRRRSRKGENRVEASHGPYARGQDLLAQRRNSRTKFTLEEVAGPCSKPARGVTFAIDSFIPTAANSSQNYRDASRIQLPIKSALKSGSKSRPTEHQEVKILPLYQEMKRSSHYAVATAQDFGEASQVLQVSLGLRYPSPEGTLVEVVDGHSPSEDTTCAASRPPECRPIVRSTAMMKTEDLRAEFLRSEQRKAELQWDEHLDSSRRTPDREGQPKLSLCRFFSAMGLNRMGKMGKDSRSSSMEHLSPSSTRASSSQTQKGQTLLQRTPSLQALHTESPLAHLRKASSVQSLMSPKKKHERANILRELHLPLILGHRYTHLKKEMKNLDSTKVSEPMGRIIQTFPDGSLLLKLTRPVDAPFGFVISRGKGRPNSGIYVEQVVGSATENIYTSLLGVGDEILEVNGEQVTGMSLDQVTCLMTRKTTATVRILPHRWIQH